MNQHIETEIQETDLNEEQNSGKNVISDKPKRKYTKHKKNQNGVISEKNYQSESVGGLKTEKPYDKCTVKSVIDDKPKRKYTKCKKSENCVSSETNDKSMSIAGIKSEKTGRKYKTFLYEKCTICEKSFSQSKMKYHIISHTDQRPYKCELCPKTYKYPKHLSYHMRTHSDKPSYYCEVCGEGFTVVERLKNHSFTHTDFRPFSCEICGAGFAKKSGLSRHMSVHTGKKKEQCDRCGMRFVNKYNLDLHISSVHKKERRFACDECDKTFVTNYELKCHIMSHSGVRPYKCTLCNADFIQRKELRRHMLKQHGRSLDEKKGHLTDSQITTSQPEESNDVGYVIKVELEDALDKGRYGNEHITIITTEKSNDNLYLQPSEVTEEIHTDQNASVTLNMCQYEPVSFNTVAGMDSAVVIDDGTYLVMEQNST